MTQRSFVIWDTRTGEEIAAPEAHLGAVDSMAFTPDGLICCTGGGDGGIELWDARTWTKSAKTIEGRHNSRVKSVAFSADRKTLASASENGLIKLWYTETGGHLLTLHEHDSAVESIRFSHDGRLLVSHGVDGKFRFWTAATLRAAPIQLRRISGEFLVHISST